MQPLSKAGARAEHHDTLTGVGNLSRSLSDQGQLAADRGGERERERERSIRNERAGVAEDQGPWSDGAEDEAASGQAEEVCHGASGAQGPARGKMTRPFCFCDELID